MKIYFLLEITCYHVTTFNVYSQVVYANDNDYEEYQYEEVDLTKIQNKGGGRLVGARAARTAEYPFLVGWNMFGIDNNLMCTGSLLTSRYFLSAAHCNNIVEQKKNRKAKKKRMR